ncbi:fumarylacetoacetate hydrolase family protein [Candidatus Sulfidibacterium hydrothermale]|uniref:fumarylacetoacetate hydrolase family protein n=1 Tax=Candidatus Sulfidibacterium hydrothermale TaxID=2875962 RepID=UPI001F0AFF78|nr:fumarylacetoacetate hydrolase family protein [Candidatus Sulfidibacterium hydrothermale]UBM61640.1 fumarylacetoacetate hydrolase family protein [Candidatus Sulfidibacterium hydrothermale]
MKIICIGRNYREHAKELNNPVPEKPVFFMKPDTALLQKNNPFFYPDFSNEVHYETEIVLKINRNGKHIEERFAHKYFDEIGIGIDFTARDLQAEQKKKGLPWEIAKAFDGAAPVGKFVSTSRYPDIHNLHFSLKINGELRQSGTTTDMMFSFEKIIAYVSQFISLKMGDLIFTGTPSGVGPTKIGDHFEAFIEDEKLLEFNVK